MSVRSHTILTKIQAKNYRSLVDIDVELGPLTVLVGPNSAGKSNFIDVLRFVRDAVTRGLDTAILDRHGMSAVRRWSSKGRPYDVHIHLSFHGENWRGEYGFTLGSESRGEYRIKSEILNIVHDNGLYAFFETKNGRLVEIELADIENYTPQRSLNISPNNLVLSAFSAFPSIYPAYEFLSNMGFYTIYPDGLRDPQKPANPYPLEERGQNLASVLRNLKNSDVPDVIQDALGKVVEGVSSYSVTQVGGYLVTRLHHTQSEEGRQGPAFELAQESDGTLRMLGILAALYQEPPRSLLTIEEPELTIHPGALAVLCDVLQEASLRSQVIITTHNPDLVDRFPADAIRVVEKENGATEIGPVSEEQRQIIAQKLFSPGDIMRIEGLQRELIDHSME